MSNLQEALETALETSEIVINVVKAVNAEEFTADEGRDLIDILTEVNNG